MTVPAQATCLARRGMLLAPLSLLAACSESPKRISLDTSPPVPVKDPVRRQVLNTALAQIGRPYRDGGEDPQRGFDCSGLTQYAFAAAGVRLPRSSAAQHAQARKIEVKEAQPGDLLFFRTGRRGIGHVAIYLGEGRFVHAPSSGKTVETLALNESSYWKRRLVGAGRVI